MTDTTSEQYRHECEVRAVVRMKDDEARADYLRMVKRQRGEAAAQRLRMDAWALMQRERR